MKALLALIICTVFFAGSSANATVYEINLSVGAGSVTGVIETNANGELSSSDIVDWNLLINNGAKSFNLLGPLSGNNSQGLVSGPGFTATPTCLFLLLQPKTVRALSEPVCWIRYKRLWRELLGRSHDCCRRESCICS